MKLFVLLIALSFGTKQSNNAAKNDDINGRINNGEKEPILVKIEEEEYAKKEETSSQFMGVSYDFNRSKWKARRHSKHEKKNVYNGYYVSEETAAHASDTLARKLMANGEQRHKLNFPNDETEVFPEERTSSSQYIGVIYDVKNEKWHTQRHSKLKKKVIYNGTYKDAETAALASDTLARKLMANGEQGHKLNFPDDNIEVFPEENSSQYIGVSYDAKYEKWRSQRRSKHEKIMTYNGRYHNEETAAHASDTLARILTAKGEQGHKLNFPNSGNEAFPKERQTKRKRPHHEELCHPKND